MIDLDEVYLGSDVAENITRVYKGANLIFERTIGPVFDPDVQALLDQAVIDGYTACSGDVLTALNTFVIQLKADGIWDNTDAMWMVATNGDSDFATYNLKDPTSFQLIKVNSPSFIQNEGFRGDAISAYLNTQFTPSTDGVNYIRDDASFAMYVLRSGNQGNAFDYALGVRDGSSARRSFLIPRETDTYWTSIQGRGGADTVTRPTGFFHTRRDATTTYFDYNGVQVRTSIGATTFLEPLSFYLLAENNSNSADKHFDGLFSFMMFGDALDTKSLALYQAVETYITTIQ